MTPNSNLIRNTVDLIKSKINPKTGFIDAADHQAIMETNGKLDRALNSPQGTVQQDAQQIKGALDDVLKRTDPKLYAARNDTDYKYAVMKALEKASSDSLNAAVYPPIRYSAHLRIITRGLMLEMPRN